MEPDILLQGLLKITDSDIIHTPYLVESNLDTKTNLQLQLTIVSTSLNDLAISLCQQNFLHI
jgi:hypothetical protein